MTDRVGQQVGNYHLVHLLGTGGFAEVYLGEHVYLKTPAAIKLLLTKVAHQADLEGFLKEAQTIAQLVHPQIVRVMDFGLDGETPFLVMDYARGGTLRERHPRGAQLPLQTIIPYVKQIAEALQYAHEEKFIHRDVKPENMLVGRRDAVLLSDFGIALIAQSSRYQSTQEVIGTVAYMSPEQIQGKPRPASDQYSLGIVVYEWLSGDRPFHGSFTELCTQHMFASPPPLHEKVSTLSPTVEQVVMRALAKDPHERFGTIQTFATALEQASQLEPTVIIPAHQSVRPTDEKTMLSPSPQPTNTRPSESFIPTELITPANQSALPASASPDGSRATLRKNAIGLPGVLFQSITAMAPATAVATALSPAVPFAGASLPLAVVCALIACVFIAACIGQLAIHIPSAGGMYTYISRSLGTKWGFMSAWTFLIAQPLLLPLVALVWGPYLESIIKTLTGVDISWVVWALLGNAVLFALTYYGIKLSADVSLILGAIEIAIVVALSITMIVASGGHNTLATFTSLYSAESGLGGWVGIFQGMIFVFLAFVGFETAAPLGEETINPKRNIPRAVIYSAIGIGLLYVLASYAGVTGWGIPKIAGYGTDPAPWATLGSKFWGSIGPLIISFAILNSALGNGNAGINASTRVAYAMGRIGTLPSAFARLSKHQTPSFAIAVHTMMSIVVSIGCGLIFGVGNGFGLIGAVLTLGLLFLYVASCVSTFVFYLRERRQEFRIWQHVIVPLIPVIILFFVISAQVYPVPVYPLNLTVPILVVWLVLGIIYMIYLNRTRPAALERGKKVYLVDTETEPTGLASGLL